MKVQNNGKELKTCLFSMTENAVVSAQFEKRCFDEIADDKLEAFFDEQIMPAFDADIVKLDKEAPEYMINLLRTGIVLPVAINAEANKELLKGIPHRKVMDLALVYRLLVRAEDDGVSSVLYTNQNMELAGVTEEDLFERALQHARENIRINDLFDILGEASFMLEDEGVSNSRGGMTVIRSELSMFGAGLLALWALEDGITIDLGSDKPLYVLPSSIHELLVVHGIDARQEDVNRFASMVQEVNYAQVLPEERLSNSVYLYEPDTKKVKMAKLGESLLGRSKEAEFEEFCRKMFA